MYSDADADVEPAALLRPQLPGVIAVGADRASESVLELTISAKGTVERVQLISMENRLSDKMLLAAAKAWQFRPAMKDGRPVRYRLRLGVAR
jgi:TonB family protein